ncbi:hypothetical protein [Aurantivibrio plasticivorans]
MKTITMRIKFIGAVSFALFLHSAQAEEAGEALYESRCGICHNLTPLAAGRAFCGSAA